MKKILFLSSWYPNRVFLRDGNFVQKHAEAVAESNQVIVLHAVQDKSLQENIQIDYSERKGVQEIIVYYRKKSSIITPIGSLFSLMQAYHRGYKYIKDKFGKPDLVHLQVIFPAGIYAVFLKYFYNLPFIITEHWTGYLPENRKSDFWVRRFVTRFCGNRGKLLAPVSENLGNALTKYGIKLPVRVVYNVVDTELFKPGNHTGIFTFLHVSTLKDQQKNISGILRVVKKLSEIRQDFVFKIMGDGDLSPHVKYAECLSISKVNLIFEGEKETEEIAWEMQRSDCFVLFSNYENLPCVMVEAMACGLPVIATDVGGIREHLSDDFGILIRSHDETALFNAMLRMIEKGRGYNKEKLRAYAVDNFSYRAVCSRYEGIYKQF